MEQLDLLAPPERPATPETSEPHELVLPEIPEQETLPEDLHQRVTALLGGAFGNAIRETFALMEVAEEVISERMKAEPKNADAINASFKFLSPTDPLQGLSEDLYRHHANEILSRVISGGDVNLATTAELIGAISKLSTVAPPTRALTLLYMKLFAEVFPERGEEFFSEFSPDRYEEERMTELESVFRRKLRVKRDCTA